MSFPAFSAASATARASRRAAAGRVEAEPVAICRLKRIAADHRDDVSDRLPRAPKQKNGKRVVCIGAGPASLTVANDLMPLGYEVTIFEKWGTPGGLMRTNIPAFRLPERVLAEEIGYIVDLGVDLRLGSPVTSMKQLLASGEFDAVFVGSGAPKGKDLDLPGRRASPAVEEHIHIGIDWLESVAFDHIKEIGRKVLIIGVGNTAMDCCRTSLRLGADDVKVMARKPRGFFKASEWELEDAEEEHVEIVVNHSPKSFVVEGGKLTGMLFDKMEYDLDAKGRITAERVVGRAALPVRRRDPGDRPGERVPVDREATWGSSSTSGTCRRSTRSRSSRRGRKCSSAATRRSARRTSSGRSSTAIRRRSRSTSSARAERERAPAAAAQSVEPQDGPPRVVVQERLQPGRAAG
jgi:NADPH-dependent 2,4-dienoyl-CoA reductase/sulfur reductase-like enzyme